MADKFTTESGYTVEGAKIVYTKPPFREAMQRARDIARGPFDPPLSRRELFSVYRSCRHGGSIFLRCRINNLQLTSSAASNT